MSTLRQRMTEAMVLRGFAERTKETCLACVSGLAKHYGRSPDTLDTAAIQAYLLHLITERKLAYASVNQALCAIRFLFAVVLGRRDAAFEIPMVKVPTRLPQILTREEVARLLDSARDIRARTLLTTTYAAGLRLSEVCHLQVGDIESSPERMCIKVCQGKGGKDRYTLLSPRLLETLAPAADPATGPRTAMKPAGKPAQAASTRNGPAIHGRLRPAVRTGIPVQTANCPRAASLPQNSLAVVAAKLVPANPPPRSMSFD